MPWLKRSAALALFGLGLAGAIASAGSPATAQTFPARHITLIVPFAAGGPSDAMARIIAEGLARQSGWNVVVENVAGAGGSTGSARASKAEPDGHTILFGNIGTHAANVGMFKKLAYDPVDDFEPITMVASVPFILAARKSLPIKDFAGFRALVATDGGKLNYGSAGLGSASHLACLLLNFALASKAVHVAYRGVGPAMNDLVAGQIDFMCDQTVTMMPQVKGGTVQPLAVMSRVRLAQLPDVPTLAEDGLPAVEVEAWNALFAPKGTPRPLVDLLAAKVSAVLNSPDTKARLQELGATIPDPASSGPEALRAHVTAEVSKWVPIIKAAGASAE
jgi:tripartite-type tricarboxylate transporter receptor subunit TctC